MSRLETAVDVFTMYFSIQPYRVLLLITVALRKQLLSFTKTQKQSRISFRRDRAILIDDKESLFISKVFFNALLLKQRTDMHILPASFLPNGISKMKMPVSRVESVSVHRDTSSFFAILT